MTLSFYSRIFLLGSTICLLVSCQSSQNGNAATSKEPAPLVEKSTSTPNSEAEPTRKILSSKIQWRNWTQASFDEAKEKKRLIFLYLTTEWCVPCTDMDLTTLSADTVVNVVNNQFLPIRVDADAMPNVSDRFALGAFPSCVIVSSDLRVIGGTMKVPVDSMSLFLSRISDLWQSSPAVIERQAALTDSMFREAMIVGKPQRPSEKLLEYTEKAVYHHYDSTYGGFGNQPKLPFPAINRFMLQATAPNGAPLFKGEIVQTLDAQLKLLDPVWGGFYRSARFADWSGTSHEKVLTDNARVMLNYLEAYQLSGEEKYRAAVEKTAQYMDKFLRASTSGGFFNSQAGVVMQDARPVDANAYFSSNDSDRRKIGIPAIDSSMHVAPNAYAISAYFRAGRTLGNKDLVDYATRSIDLILASALNSDGLARHNVHFDSEIMLEDQVALTTALLDAYETLGNRKYLEAADRVGKATYQRFSEPVKGGLQTDTPASNAQGRMAIIYRPYEVNCDAVINFVRLYHLVLDNTYRQMVDRVFLFLVGISIRDTDLRLCPLANAYLRTTRYPVKIAMVGPRDEQYDRLVKRVWDTSQPRLVVAHVGDGSSAAAYGKLSFPPTTRPQLFVCGDDTLSQPVELPDSVQVAIIQFQIALMKMRKPEAPPMPPAIKLGQ